MHHDDNSPRYDTDYSVESVPEPVQRFSPQNPPVRLDFPDVFQYQGSEGSTKLYKCLACDINYLNINNLRSHSFGKKHKRSIEEMEDVKRQKMQRQNRKETRDKPRKVNNCTAYPIGKEVSEFEKIIDSIQEPLVALEYFVEVSDGKSHSYHCALCEMKFDTKGFKCHLTSQKHMFSNLKKHFPSIASHLKTSRRFVEDSQFRTECLQKISAVIEDEFGRASPFLYKGTDFTKMEPHVIEYVNNKPHVTIQDFPNDGKVLLAGLKLFDKNWERKHPQKDQDVGMSSSNKRKLSESVIEEYLSLVLKATKEAETKLTSYERSMESHPLYDQEWARFWNKKADRIVDRGEDPTKYNFEDEWYEYFKKKIYKLHEKELEEKVDSIRKKFELSREDVKSIMKEPEAKRQKLDNFEAEPFPVEFDSKTDGVAALNETKRCTSTGKETRTESLAKEPNASVPQTSSQSVSAPPRESTNLITACRLLISLETELGMLAPKILDLLTTAISYERKEMKSSNELLSDIKNLLLVEIVKEKLIGMQLGSLIADNRTKAVETALNEINKLIEQHEAASKGKHD